MAELVPAFRTPRKDAIRCPEVFRWQQDDVVMKHSSNWTLFDWLNTAALFALSQGGYCLGRKTSVHLIMPIIRMGFLFTGLTVNRSLPIGCSGDVKSAGWLDTTFDFAIEQVPKWRPPDRRTTVRRAGELSRSRWSRDAQNGNRSTSRSSASRAVLAVDVMARSCEELYSPKWRPPDRRTTVRRAGNW